MLSCASSMLSLVNNYFDLDRNESDIFMGLVTSCFPSFFSDEKITSDTWTVGYNSNIDSNGWNSTVVVYYFQFCV